MPLPLLTIGFAMLQPDAALDSPRRCQQVRYTAGRPAEDRSGFQLTVGAEPLPLAAGMLTFASLFTLPPKEPAYKVRHVHHRFCVMWLDG